jgi:hypothetical protein
MRLRWRVERTNSWLSKFGWLAQLALAVAVLLTAKLIDYRNR